MISRQVAPAPTRMTRFALSSSTPLSGCMSRIQPSRSRLCPPIEWRTPLTATGRVLTFGDPAKQRRQIPPLSTSADDPAKMTPRTGVGLSLLASSSKVCGVTSGGSAHRRSRAVPRRQRNRRPRARRWRWHRRRETAALTHAMRTARPQPPAPRRSRLALPQLALPLLALPQPARSRRSYGPLNADDRDSQARTPIHRELLRRSAATRAQVPGAEWHPQCRERDGLPRSSTRSDHLAVVQRCQQGNAFMKITSCNRSPTLCCSAFPSAARVLADGESRHRMCPRLWSHSDVSGDRSGRDWG